MSPRRRLLPALLVPALIPLLAGLPAAGGGDPFGTHRVLGEDGSIFEWSSGGAILRRAASPLGFKDLGGTVDDLTSFAGGTRLIVLTANPVDPGKGRKRHEGLAVIYDTGRPVPAVLHRIPLEGTGYGVAADDARRRCYVLASRTDADHGGPRFWVHAIDPEAGSVSSSTLLDRPGSGIAVTPDGARLFVSFEGRIQSYTTKPLFGSWHYRSPGLNGRLYFGPGSDVLYALRSGGVARFDPAVFLERERQGTRDAADDATSRIPLPFGPLSMLFSGERRIAAALGQDAIVFIDLTSGAVRPPPERPAALRAASLVRPLEFLPRGDLVVGLFPAAVVAAVQAPAMQTAGSEGGGFEADGARTTPAAEAASAAGPSGDGDSIPAAAPSGAEPPPEPIEEPPPAGVPAPLPPPPPSDLPGPVPVVDAAAGPAPGASPGLDPGAPPVEAGIRPFPAADRPVLSGRLSGEHDLVAALVLYGPGSIIREQARVAPAPDGTFAIPLPPPGTYRLMPVGDDSGPVSATPNFRTITVGGDAGRADLDFSIARGR
jgi:hypothetical protein